MALRQTRDLGSGYLVIDKVLRPALAVLWRLVDEENEVQLGR